MLLLLLSLTSLTAVSDASPPPSTPAAAPLPTGPSYYGAFSDCVLGYLTSSVPAEEIDVICQRRAQEAKTARAR